MPVYRCSFCPVSRRQLSEIQSHHSDSHNRFTNLCHYCNLAFNDKNLFKEHIRKQHVLSVHDKSRIGNPIVHQQGHQQPEQQHQQQQRRTLTWSAFRKNLRSNLIVDSNNTVGLLDFMTAERNEINDIIEQKTLNEGPQKVQFSAKLSLHKEARDNGEASDIDIYANSEMTPVYHQLSDEAIFHMVEKMLTVLSVFASKGSRWFLQKIIWVDLTFAKFSPLHGSSFIELPLCLRNQRFFLNIRNHDDFECFNYCYTTRYHEVHEPNSANSSQDIRTQLTNQTTYGKPEAANPTGSFLCQRALSQRAFTIYISSKWWMS